MDELHLFGHGVEHFSEALPVPGAPDSDTLLKNLKALLETQARIRMRSRSEATSSWVGRLH